MSRELASLQMRVSSSHQPLKLFLMKFRQVPQIEYAAWRAVVGDKRQGESIAVTLEDKEMYVAEKASMVLCIVIDKP